MPKKLETGAKNALKNSNNNINNSDGDDDDIKNITHTYKLFAQSKRRQLSLE